MYFGWSQSYRSRSRSRRYVVGSEDAVTAGRGQAAGSHKKAKARWWECSRWGWWEIEGRLPSTVTMVGSVRMMS